MACVRILGSESAEQCAVVWELPPHPFCTSQQLLFLFLWHHYRWRSILRSTFNVQTFKLRSSFWSFKFVKGGINGDFETWLYLLQYDSHLVSPCVGVSMLACESRGNFDPSIILLLSSCSMGWFISIIHSLKHYFFAQYWLHGGTPDAKVGLGENSDLILSRILAMPMLHHPHWVSLVFLVST